MFVALTEASAVKCGVYVPKMPTSNNGHACRTGVVLFTRGEQGEEMCVGRPLWRGNGEFDDKQGRKQEQPAAKVESCQQKWKDEEVMQLEFSYVHPQWMLRPTHLRSGKSSTARGNLKSQLSAVRAFVGHPESSPMYLLPAFF